MTHDLDHHSGRILKEFEPQRLRIHFNHRSLKIQISRVYPHIQSNFHPSFIYKMCQQEISSNGWASMPADARTIFGDKPFINIPGPLPIDEIKFPFQDPIVIKTLEYAKKTLHSQTLNHSMRVYHYGKTCKPNTHT